MYCTSTDYTSLDASVGSSECTKERACGSPAALLAAGEPHCPSLAPLLSCKAAVCTPRCVGSTQVNGSAPCWQAGAATQNKSAAEGLQAILFFRESAVGCRADGLAEAAAAAARFQAAAFPGAAHVPVPSLHTHPGLGGLRVRSVSPRCECGICEKRQPWERSDPASARGWSRAGMEQTH